VSTGTQVEVVMPQMGVSVSEGTVTKWLKQQGEHIALDEPLLEISTDKVDTEVPSPGEGVVAQILVAEGETVEVGTVLAVIAPEGAAAAPAEPASPARPEPGPAAPPEPAPVAQPEPIAAQPEPVTAAQQPAAPEPPAVSATPAPAPPAPAAAPPTAPAPTPLAAGDGNGRSFVSPVVARIAAEHGVDPSGVPGTGQGGRVTKKDILAFIESGGTAAAPPPAAAPEAPAAAPQAPAPAPAEAAAPTPAAPEVPAAPPPPAPEAPAAAPPVASPPAAAPAPAQTAPPAPPTPTPTPAPAAATPPPAPPAPPTEPELAVGETAEPVTAMRRGVMEHMRRSLDTSAHVTSAIEIDMSRVVAIREQLKADYQRNYGVNPTYLSFVARATVDTLRTWPWVNGEIRGEKIVTRQFVHLGIAVALDEGKGLIVPVVRNAEGLNLLGMARAIADLAERARTKKLLPDDVRGGTFTITNPGGFGTFHGTPIINQPQVGILGTYALVKRPWVVQDELGDDVIAIRPMMNLTLTYDHRVVDGAYAGGFLHDLRERLETWDESAY
jgi:2-oxoglutarate dehydrogenase E2 component (dihydrolipoamide succinyltransferase)